MLQTYVILCSWPLHGDMAQLKIEYLTRARAAARRSSLRHELESDPSSLIGRMGLPRKRDGEVRSTGGRFQVGQGSVHGDAGRVPRWLDEPMDPVPMPARGFWREV